MMTENARRADSVQRCQSKIVPLCAVEEHVEEVPDLSVALIQHLHQRNAVLRLDVAQLDENLDNFGRRQ